MNCEPVLCAALRGHEREFICLCLFPKLKSFLFWHFILYTVSRMVSQSRHGRGFSVNAAVCCSLNFPSEAEAVLYVPMLSWRPSLTES